MTGVRVMSASNLRTIMYLIIYLTATNVGKRKNILFRLTIYDGHAQNSKRRTLPKCRIKSLERYVRDSRISIDICY